MEAEFRGGWLFLYITGSGDGLNELVGGLPLPSDGEGEIHEAIPQCCQRRAGAGSGEKGAPPSPAALDGRAEQRLNQTQAERGQFIIRAKPARTPALRRGALPSGRFVVAMPVHVEAG